jgi:hypothetical protein
VELLHRCAAGDILSAWLGRGFSAKGGNSPCRGHFASAAWLVATVQGTVPIARPTSPASGPAASGVPPNGRFGRHKKGVSSDLLDESRVVGKDRSRLSCERLAEHLS